jgi:multidrug resistance efflux pump
VPASEANQHRVQLDVDRYTPLVQAQAITQQDFDDAGQNNMAAKAQLQAARPQVETARAQITAATAAGETPKAALKTAQIDIGLQKVQEPSS